MDDRSRRGLCEEARQATADGHLPIRAEASSVLLGGHVMTAETGVGTAAWFDARKSGKVKILATLSAGGLSAFDMPEIEGIEEYGSDYVVRTTYGFVVPADVPATVRDKLVAAIEKVINDPKVQAQFAEIDLPLT